MATETSQSQQVSLKSLLVPSKTVEVEYPGMPGFKVQLGFMSRENLINLRKKSTKTTFKNRQTSEDFNEDLFLELYAETAVKGWSGLKFKFVEQLVPVDVSQYDPEDFLGFSKENALMLMKNSSDFDNFISEFVSDLGKFSKNS
jgi:hypothetical protein